MKRVQLTLAFVLLMAWPLVAKQRDFFPVDDLREGMRGTGKTVFHGTTIEEFSLEVLGVLRNTSPRQDMILARLSGGPLEDTGVLQGMSGSPVYIDGRLVGAVAFAFDGSREPIAGIQPIGQMVGVLDRAPEDLVAGSGSRALRLPEEAPAAYVYRVVSGLRSGGSIADYLGPPVGAIAGLTESRSLGGMRPIRSPVFLSGISAGTIRQFQGALERAGLTSVQGGVAGATAQSGPTNSVIEPGASINAELVRGDIHVSANGTVTHVEGERVYAFGHPFQSIGPTSLPMSPGYVMALVPTRTTSFKIAAPMDAVGRFEQDRATGILGRIGADAAMIPVRVEVQTAQGRIETYEYEVIDDAFMTPLMMNLSLFELILATERNLGPLTIEVDGTLRLNNGETVQIMAAASGNINAPAEATLATVAPITYLLSGAYEPLGIDSIELDVRSVDDRRSARLDAVRVNRNEVRAGETVELEATLRTLSGEEFRETYTVPIPAGLAPGTLELVIGDGIAITGRDLRRAPPAPPRSMEEILRELGDLRRMDRLYVNLLAFTPGAVIGGAELPSLPPSLRAVLDSARTSNTYTSSTGTSPVLEFELTPSGYLVEGQQSLSLTVLP